MLVDEDDHHIIRSNKIHLLRRVSHGVALYFRLSAEDYASNAGKGQANFNFLKRLRPRRAWDDFHVTIFRFNWLESKLQILGF